MVRLVLAAQHSPAPPQGKGAVALATSLSLTCSGSQICRNSFVQATSTHLEIQTGI